MGKNKSKFVEDEARLPRFQGGQLPSGWIEFDGPLPELRKTREKESWLYNVKGSYQRMSQLNQVIRDLRKKMLENFRTILKHHPPDRQKIIAAAAHVSASYVFDPNVATADELWPLEIQPDDGEQFMSMNGSFLWECTPYPKPHNAFSRQKQSHIEIYGGEFHRIIQRNMPQMLQSAEVIKR